MRQPIPPSRRLLLSFAAASALLWGCSKSEAPAPAPAAGPASAAAAPALPAKVVIGLDDNFPPMGFRDDKNALVGFDIDLAR